MTLATDRLEMEEIARQVLLVLFDDLNAEMDLVSADWDSRDQEFWARLDRAKTVVLENIEPENFYPGHRPSLIEAPVEKYPNCSVYTFAANPAPSDDDSADKYQIVLAVELMCKSITDENEVNSRIHRTVEAAHSVLSRHGARELGGYVSGLVSGTPTITIGDVFVRRHEKSRGDRWFWQGGRLEYRLERFVNYYG